MKNILLLTILSITIWKSYSRDPYGDSLVHELSVTKADTTKLKIFLYLFDHYSNYSPDSVLYYGPFAFGIARKLGDKRSEAWMYFFTSISYSVLGNLSNAVEADLRGLHLAEQTNDLRVHAHILLALGRYYNQSKEYGTALAYFQKGLKLYEAQGSQDFVILAMNQIASDYQQTGLTDSAEYYSEQSFQKWKEYIKKENTIAPFIYPAMLSTRAEIETQKKNYDSAVKDFEAAISISHSGALIRDYIQLGNVFMEMDQPDSAAIYARRSLSLSEKIMQYYSIADAAKLLAEIYAQKDPQQAIFYQKKAIAAYDSATQQMKSSAIKNLVGFDEQQQKYEIEAATAAYKSKVRQYALLSGLAVLLLIAFILFRNNRQKQKSNKILQQTLSNLKSTQSQLIQSEKMASLGELTAGIAHEIQNPLNFVNNFSEVNKEMVDEASEEIDKGNYGEVKCILNDIKDNSEKINHHGKRADGIVKSMLKHSRTSTGVKEPTDINKLTEEYLRLAYHGMRAKDKAFNAEIKTNFDDHIGKIDIVPQDIGRVLLNLNNNAFYAVYKKVKQQITGYKPTVTVTTKQTPQQVEITVKDNGNGIPDSIKGKIFQPFFTTKSTGQGTGLGLSLAYDIVRAHGGEINVTTKENEGTEFMIQLPVK